VFNSLADLLHDGLSDSTSIYLRDMQTGDLTRIGHGDMPKMSGNGRFVVFTTQAALVGNDTNSVSDVYVKDLQTGDVELVSCRADGGVSTAGGSLANISLDGSTIVFRSSGELVGDSSGGSSAYVVSNPLYVRTLQGGSATTPTRSTPIAMSSWRRRVKAPIPCGHRSATS